MPPLVIEGDVVPDRDRDLRRPGLRCPARRGWQRGDGRAGRRFPAAGRVMDQQVSVAARDGVTGERARPGPGLRGARRLQQFPGIGAGHAQGAGEAR
jgi:hypothetical protein